MKIKIWEGATLNEAAQNLVKSIDNSDLDVEHFVIVPDRFSLLMERLLLKHLPRKSMFNISVVGLSTLATKILGSMGIGNIDMISTSDALLLTAQAIKNVSSDFLRFKKSNINFCHEIYKAISQLKSCGVTPKDLIIKNGSVAQQRKYHDLSLIFEEYERLLQGRLDANGLLDYFITSVAGTNVLNGKKFYFAMFDSFTQKTFDLIKILISFSDEVNIALAAPTAYSNAYVYEDDVFDKVKKIANELSIVVDTVSPKNTLTERQGFLAKNLYSQEAATFEGQSDITLISALNTQEEVEAVGRIIKFNVARRGARYRDFAVACSNPDYSAFEKTFSELEIPYFIDKAETADNSILANFIFQILNVFINDYSKESLKTLCSNLVLNLPDSDSLCDLIDVKNIFGKERFKRFSNLLPSLAPLLKIFEVNSCKQLAQAVRLAITQYKDNYLALLEKIKARGLSQEYNINLQIEPILLDAISKLENFQDETCSKIEFQRQLKLLLSFKEVSSVPTYVDAVMIGDATASYFGQVENLFVVGGESLPQTSGDNGLVSDDDIEKLNVIKKIEPTIRMINRRNRFKLFNLLIDVNKNIVITFKAFNELGQKIEVPTYIDSIIKMFNLKVLTTSHLERVPQNPDFDRLLFLYGTKKFAQEQGLCPMKLKKDDNLSVDSFSLFFPKEYTKVTQLETYFNCPFKHFIRYGLRAKDVVKHDFDSRDIGNIAHAMAELFVNTNKQNLGNLADEEISNFINANLDYVLRKEDLKDKLEIALNKNTVLHYIQKVLTLTLSRIRDEQQVSAFRPLYTEKNIYGTIKYKGGNINLVGKIDRVDVAGNYFRIMDYKTGIVDSILKDLYYGNKIQLFLYQNEAGKVLNKNAAGAFYFDARWDYDDEDGKDVLLKGIVKNDDEVISLFDKSDNGNVLAVSKKKDGSYTGRCIAKSSLANFEIYAERLASQAVDEICEGYIQPKPSKEACAKCQYQSICLFDQSGYRRYDRIEQNNIIDALEVKDGSDE